MTRTAPPVIERVRALVEPALRSSIDNLDPAMRLICGYQMGWWDEHGVPASGGSGKGIRSTMAVVSASAACGQPGPGVPPAVAVELVHNFSLLHDDVMDRDVERRHRPTAWTVFGDGQAILGGNAMLVCAIETLVAAGAPGLRALPTLLAATQRLITGQSDDLRFERSPVVDLAACLRMEAGKTAALMACATSIGAQAAGASPDVVAGLAAFGEELGMAFQLVDDILGISGDPAVTGKSASSDVRAGKRSAPVVAALAAGGPASGELAELLEAGPPSTEADVERATALIDAAGGLTWAATEADERLRRALAHVEALPLTGEAIDDLVSLARYVVDRDH